MPPKESKTKEGLKVPVPVGIAILVLLIGFIIISRYTNFFSGFKSEVDNIPESKQVPINKIENVNPSQELKGFPGTTEFPLPANAVVVKAYRATSLDNQIQVTKTLTSPKGVDENYAFFKDIIQNKKYGWSIVYEVNKSSQPNDKAIFARSSNGTMNINIHYNPTSKETYIDLSFLLNKE